MSEVDNSIKSSENTFWQVGKKYFVRNVTMHIVGELIYFDDKDFVFKDASWVADSGRWSTALRTGVLSEVEPFQSNVSVSRAAYVDATEWLHDLPREPK